MTRVLYLAFESRLGGAEICLLALLDGLAGARVVPLVVVGADGPLVTELRRRAIDVRIDPRLGLLVRDARSPARVLANVRDFVRVVAGLRRLIRAEGVDLVHAFVTPALKYGGLAARLAGVAAVGTLHDTLGRLFRRAALHALAGNVNILYDRLIVPSEAARDAARQAGVREERIVVLPNGVDTARFRRDPEAGRRVRAELDLPAEAPLVGMVGRFLPGKGHDVLLRALARVRPGVCGLLVGGAGFAGEHEWLAWVRDLARDLALGGRVVFADWQADVAGVLSALDVYVHPATEAESLPTAVLEAMACGLPVVASALGGAREIVRDGVTGCLVAPGDDRALAAALTRLLDDADRRRAMGAAARARVEADFTVARHCAAVVAEYDRALGGRR